MKNIKISYKLLVSFVITIILSVLIGSVGIIGMVTINKDGSNMYFTNTEPIPYLANVNQLIQRMCVSVREYVIGTAFNNPEQIENAYIAIEDYKLKMDESLDKYQVTMVNPKAIKLFDEARTLYDKDFKTFMQKCYEYAKSGDSASIMAEKSAISSTIELIINNFEQCMDIKVEIAGKANHAGDILSRNLLILIIITLIISVVISIFFAFYISGLISKPISFMKEVLLRIGMKGDLEFSDTEYRQIGEYAKCKDEVGESFNMLMMTVKRLVDADVVLENVANGDLTANLTLLSEDDTMGLSINKMQNNLNNMFSEINNATEQVATGARQIAEGSQTLAQGSTQQASAVEQLSSSISEIAEKTKDNAQMAIEAAKLADIIRGNAQKGSSQMDEMISAVKEINQASQNINKVNKVIDDIAFQTNILALNAAVEAARAGQFGKGFAVVAEEVRNLAAKSAEAAKDTERLIANSIEKAELGARIADETAESLIEIVSGINESTQLVSKIAKSSDEQSTGISQINKGIDQVAQVIQQNSATAEESAAASEEMSGQSDMLQELVSQFKLKESNNSLISLSSDFQKMTDIPKRLSDISYIDNEDYGKY